MDKRQTLEGAVTGAVLAAASGFAREGDETQRRIRIARDDSTRALREIEDLHTRGDTLRARMPVVQDFLAGLSIANQPSQAPSVTPNTAALNRPDLATTMQTAVESLMWPPEAGQYDERGHIVAVGELTALGSALTTEEARAWLQGLVQPKPPTTAHKVQIYLAANALLSVLQGTNLTREEHAAAWKRLFASGTSGPGGGTSGADPHRLATYPPAAQVIDPGVASVVPLGQPELINYPYAHQNTDSASKWRMTLGASVAAGVTAFQINFGAQPWLKDGKPYQPVVVCSSPLLVVSVVTSNGFTVKTAQALSAATPLDVGFAVWAG